MKKQNPFELDIGRPIDVKWESGKFLGYEESDNEVGSELESLSGKGHRFVYRYLFIVLALVTAVFFARLLDLEILNFDIFQYSLQLQISLLWDIEHKCRLQQYLYGFVAPESNIEYNHRYSRFPN